MDCREFRKKHFAFVDDTLPGVELVGMQVHIGECGECARQDAIIRRSLMLFRSLPVIEPSSGFSACLQQKLRNARVADATAAQSGRALTFAATVAITSVVMLGYIGVSLRQVDFPQDIVLPPVVATASSPGTVSMMAPAPAMVASVPAGLLIWTAALFAEQTPVHFASADLTPATR
ncbi:MAG: hypothetical protein Q7S20_07860 [Gemmatimonadaceae bacterium]|nr:hypothetical protein [Gemmatimonadaceae bacterium]